MNFSDLTDLTSAIYDAREQVRQSDTEYRDRDVLFRFILRAWDLPSYAQEPLQRALTGAISAGECYRSIRRLRGDYS